METIGGLVFREILDLGLLVGGCFRLLLLFGRSGF